MIMGMFDELQCKVPLPAKKGFKTAKEWKNYTFQTKDLDNSLSRYEIRKSGLWYHQVKYKDTLVEHKFNDLWSIPGLEVESEKWVKEPFTGYIHFYDFISDYDDTHDAWIEFRAHFREGSLQDKVELVKWELEDNAERKASDAKWKKELAESNAYKEKWRYKYLFKYWNRLIDWKFRLLRRIINYISSNSWNLERWLKV